MNNEVNNAKQILLEWLIAFGRKEITMYELFVDGEIDSIDMYWFTDRGLVSENTKTDIYRYALTDKAIDFLNKGENDGTNK
jgi:hypothetical protein